MSGIVFISYRRSDAATYAGRLYDRLEARLTSERIFMDVDSIAAGEDFVRVMRAKVTECDVLLAVIGENWIETTARDGGRRLDDPDDPVRIEIETALAAEKKIIPVLCGAAQMPERDRLPASLRALSTINAVRIENERFRTDMATLERALDKALGDAESRRKAEEDRRAREAEQARQEEVARQDERRRAADAAEEVRRKRDADEAERKRAAEADAFAQRGREPSGPMSGSVVDGAMLHEQISKAEELARWDFIKSRGRIVELREHLTRWPNGITSQMARATLESLEWDALGRSPDEAALRDFIERFPDGEHLAAAERRLATLSETLHAEAEAEQSRLRQQERDRDVAARRSEQEAKARAEAQAREEAERVRERAAPGRGDPQAAREVARVERLTKVFDGDEALSDVSLRFRSGEILGLLGQSGAGKSTLLHLLGGLIAPDSGAISVGGRLLGLGGAKEAHAAGIRVVRQEPDIVADLSVAENIFVGALPRRVGALVDWQVLEDETRALLSRFGMSGTMDARELCGRLGPAQRQLVEIMRAVRAGGRLIAFDEPTSSLSGEQTPQLIQVIRQLKSDGVSIVYACHRSEDVLGLADRIAVLRDGRLVAERPVADLTEQAISQSMAGDVSNLRLSPRTPAMQEPVLKVSGLNSEAVRDVSLTLHRGEVLGVGGLVGAGHPDLARAILGLNRRLSGEVVVDGRSLRPNDVAAAIGAGIGFVPQDRRSEALLLASSVLDNAALCVPELISTVGMFDRRKAIALLAPLFERLSIPSPSLDQPISRLAGGQQQKVVLARWLARQPRIIILEEPTRGIDTGARAAVYDLIAELAAGGVGILLISSDVHELVRLADRILVMADGRIESELDGDIDEQRLLVLVTQRTAEARHGVKI